MQTIHEIDMLHTSLTELRAGGTRIVLVPTMGALHEGHLALIARAKQLADKVVVSIFVNPKQFGANEDFSTYPRTLTEDQAKLAAAGVDLLWAPNAETMYPAGFATNVSVAGLGDQLCGAARPGHFEGVATVVTKLFAQIRPDVAVFGEKDWQQLTIIRRLNTDLNLGVEIIGAPIVREADGLAMSSRNAYLSSAARQIAGSFPAILRRACAQIAAGAPPQQTLRDSEEALRAAGVERIDYLHLIDPDSLAILNQLIPRARIIAAIRIDATRLIDNMPIVEQET